jgi:hypothetical protein
MRIDESYPKPGWPSCRLALEAAGIEFTNGEAPKAAEIVRIKANIAIAHRLVSELPAARNIYWKLAEVLSGFFLLDEHRHAM